MYRGNEIEFVIYRNYVPLEVINYPKEFIFRIFSFITMGDFLKGYLKGFCAKKSAGAEREK